VSDCFRGTTALVTGASSGLGEQFARQLAARGCNLILAARSLGKLQVLADELSRAHAIRADCFAADLSAPEQVDALCSHIAQLGLEVDHLVNNAGFGTAGPMLSRDPVSQQQMVLLNVFAPVTLTVRLLPGMIARKSGGVLNVASVAAFFPIPFMATYAASKAFLFSHTQALAEETRGTGVRITGLCPGPVRTGFQKAAGYELGGLERLAEFSSQRVVRTALAAYERRKVLCVPGFLNKIEVWLPRFIPHALAGPIVGAIMRLMGRS